MKRTHALGIMPLMVVLLLLFTGVASGGPIKPDDPYAGKTAGNTGFANFVGTNDPNYADGQYFNGWVRYSKNSKSLHTTWVVRGLQPSTMYQLKLHSKGGDEDVGNACGAPNTGDVWMCAFLGRRELPGHGYRPGGR